MLFQRQDGSAVGLFLPAVLDSSLMDIFKVYALLNSTIQKVNLISSPGHWFREHYPGSHLWQGVQKLSSAQERCLDCFRRYRRRPAHFRYPQRLLVPKMVPHHLYLHHDRVLRPISWLIRCTWLSWRHACSPHRIPFSGWYWNWRRISRWKCRRRRRNRRTQARAPQQMVRHRHKLHDRHGLRNWHIGSYDRCPDYIRETPESRMAYLPRHRSHPAYHPPRVPLPAQGTRGVQPPKNAKIPIRPDNSLLLEAPPRHLYYLVHLRLPRLLLWHLLQFLAVFHYRGYIPTVDQLRLGDSHKCLLRPWRLYWCFLERLDWT